MNIGDEVVVGGRVIGISESDNPIIEFKSGIRVLVKASDIKSIHPYKPAPKKDERKGK